MDPETLLTLLSFTSPRDPWSTPFTLRTSTYLLSLHTAQTETTDFITNFLLQSIIRPLFSKSKPIAVTSSGRKSMPTSAPPKKFDAGGNNRSTKPWKYEAPYTITVLEWTVLNSSVGLSPRLGSTRPSAQPPKGIY